MVVQHEWNASVGAYSIKDLGGEEIACETRIVSPDEASAQFRSVQTAAEVKVNTAGQHPRRRSLFGEVSQCSLDGTRYPNPHAMLERS
jgi:hypothetical protein